MIIEYYMACCDFSSYFLLTEEYSRVQLLLLQRKASRGLMATNASWRGAAALYSRINTRWQPNNLHLASPIRGTAFGPLAAINEPSGVMEMGNHSWSPLLPSKSKGDGTGN